MRLSHLARPATFALVLAATMALAHGPTPQKVNQSIAIKASPDAVWKVAGDFAGIGRWHPGVAKATGEGGSKEFTALCRIDTPNELDYYRHGGILVYVLRQLAKA